MKRLSRFTAVVMACIILCLSMASCSDVSSKLKSYDSSNERYDYDLTEYITVPEYIGVEIPDLEYTPTDEKIANTRIKKLAYFSKEEVIKDGTVEKYDIVDCDYSCTVEGAPYTGLSSAGNTALRSFVVGICEFDIPEIDDGIIGMAPGETKTIEFTFPTPYYKDPLLSGYKGEFTVTLEQIRRQELDEYTDEFVSEFYGMSTTEAYDAEIVNQLKNDYGNYLEDYEIDLSWSYLSTYSEMLKIPGKEYAQLSDDAIRSYRKAAEEKNVTLEQYATEYLGFETLSAFYDDVDAYARQAVKEEMILYVIARCENITLSQEEYEEALISFASQYQTDDISVCEAMAAAEYGSVEKFKEISRLRKVYQFVADNATKIDTAEYFEKRANGDYAFDAEEARGLSDVEILIIVVSAVSLALVAAVVILAVKAASAAKERKLSAEERAAREEIRRIRREQKKAKKKHLKKDSSEE